MTQQLAINTKNWKIRTHNGFVPFVGTSTMGVKQLYRLTFNDNTSIEASANHVFYTEDGREISVKEMDVGLSLIGITNKILISIEPTVVEETYDIIEVQDHVFFANGLLCHNCEFLSSEALLISSLILINMKAQLKKEAFEKNGIRFYKPFQSGLTYLVGVDPATGSGGDFSVIQVYEFPSLEQVAEYRSNTISSPLLYTILKYILRYIEHVGGQAYFSVENNGVGEGIISLYETDETPPALAEFISEEGKNKLGMTTTPNQKLKTCITFKQLIESGRFKVHSELLLSELKAFVQKGGSYAAQRGSTDDIISACLIVVRLLQDMATYDASAYETLNSVNEDEYLEDPDDFNIPKPEDDDPMPIIT